MKFVRACKAFSNVSSPSPGVVSGNVSKISFVASPAQWSNNARFLFLSVMFIATSRLRNLESLFFHQVVCALRSLRIMGDIQNLIICVKMAWSKHLDCGVNIRYLRCRNIRFCFESLPEAFKKQSLSNSQGNKQSHSVDKCILVCFLPCHLHPVCN